MMNKRHALGVGLSALGIWIAVEGTAHAVCGQTTYTNGAPCFSTVACAGQSLNGGCIGGNGNGTCANQASSTSQANPPVDCCFCFGGEIDPGIMFGDPHMLTMDSLLYAFHAAGELVLTSDGHSFMVQARLEPAGKAVSSNTAVAAMVGSSRIGVYAKKEPPLVINGTPIEVPCSSPAGAAIATHGKVPPVDLCIGQLALHDGGEIRRDGAEYEIAWPGGERKLVVVLHEGWLDVSFTRSPTDAHLLGLLGDADGDPLNDLRTRDGRVLALPPSYDGLYLDYAESLRIAQAESLLD